jgi:type IV pilus assembly protein PilV
MMNSRKRTHFRSRRYGGERGSFLLEALISVLIVAFGVLGIVGLQARAIQNVDDAQYRGEAAYLANALLGQMWLYDKRTKTLVTDLTANFTGSGAGYMEFKAMVGQRLPGAAALTNNPTVTISAGPTANSANVVILVQWLPPGEPALSSAHRIQLSGTVGYNN